MNESGPSGGLEQLQEAVELFLAWRREEPDVSAEDFLARHPEMRELLEPMVEEGAGAGDGQSSDGRAGAAASGGAASAASPGSSDAVGEAADGAASSAPRRFGDFELIRELGRGGMGVVYEARQVSLDRRVALKLMPAAFAQDPKAIARFRREAQTAAKLEHPGIVRVLAVEVSDDVPWYAMELIEGMPLHRLLRLIDAKSLTSGHELATIVREEIELLHGPGTRRVSRVAELDGEGPSATPANKSPATRAPASRGASTRGASTRGGSTRGASTRGGSTRGGTTRAATARASAWRDGLLETLVEFALQLCDALAHAHAAGVVHRDIKPSNLLVRADGSLVLTDFGLARDFGLPSATLTGEFAGTPHYVSPEQASGKTTEIGPRSDVFSAGATIYEMLTRERAFDGDSPQAVVEKIRRDEPRDPSRSGKVPADVGAILLKCLEKEPRRRYADAGELADDLRAFRSFRPVSARRPNAVERVRRVVRRHPLETSLASAFVIVGLLVAYLWSTSGAREVGHSVLVEQEIELLLEDSLIALLHSEDRDSEIAKAASRKLARVLEADPHNPIAHFAQAVWDKHVSFAEAKKKLEASLAQRPKDRALMQVLAIVHLYLGDRDTFLELRKKAGQSVSSLEYFIEALAYAPTTGGGRDDPRWRRAAQAAVDCIVRAPRARLLYHYFWAITSSRSDDAELARRAAKALLALWPDDARAQLGAGVALSFFDVEDGEALLRKCLKSDPGLVPGWINLAICVGQQQRSEEALGYLDKALAIDSRMASAWSLRGLQLLKLGRLDESVESHRKALAIAPRNAFFRHQLACALERNDDREGAIREANIAARDAPRFPKVHEGLIKMNEIIGDTDAVRREHERWCRVNPNGAWAFGQFADWLLKQDEPSPEDIQLAVKHTWRSVRLFKTDCWLWIIRAQALAAAKDKAGALEALRKAESFLPKDNERERRRLGRGIRRLQRRLGG